MYQFEIDSEKHRRVVVRPIFLLAFPYRAMTYAALLGGFASVEVRQIARALAQAQLARAAFAVAFSARVAVQYFVGGEPP